MTRIAIVVGSTRPGRSGRLVADWAHREAHREAQRLIAAGELDAEVEVVDVADADLPMLDESVPAIVGQYAHEHTRAWSRRVASFDGFVFVVPEYNKSFPAATKNAIDFLFDEWGDKAAGFVGYGLNGGQRAVEQLRLVLSEVNVATVRSAVALSISDHVDQGAGQCVPDGLQHELLRRTLTEVAAWSGALATLRTPAADGTPAEVTT